MHDLIASSMKNDTNERSLTPTQRQIMQILKFNQDQLEFHEVCFHFVIGLLVNISFFRVHYFTSLSKGWVIRMKARQQQRMLMKQYPWRKNRLNF